MLSLRLKRMVPLEVYKGKAVGRQQRQTKFQGQRDMALYADTVDSVTAATLPQRQSTIDEGEREGRGNEGKGEEVAAVRRGAMMDSSGSTANGYGGVSVSVSVSSRRLDELSAAKSGSDVSKLWARWREDHMKQRKEGKSGKSGSVSGSANARLLDVFMVNKIMSTLLDFEQPSLATR